MKILRVIASMNPEGGGPAETTRQISRIWCEQGQEVEIACLDIPQSSWNRNADLKIHELGARAGGYGYSGAFSHWMRENAARFDCVLIQGIWQFHSACASSVCRRQEIPYFVFPHGMLDPWFRKNYPLKHLKKCLYWMLAERTVLSRARNVFFTSQIEKQKALRTFPFSNFNARVVPYGVPRAANVCPDELSELRKGLPKLCGKRVLLFLGRLHEKKGLDILLQAHAELKDLNIHLLIAGPESEYKESLLPLACKERVSWLGMVSGARKRAVFELADAFILPSHQENFGVAVAEALSCSVPVLISNKVNIFEQILADRAGLVAEDTLRGVQELLSKWMSLSDAEWQETRERACACFEAHYEMSRVSRDLLKVVSESLKI